MLLFTSVLLHELSHSYVATRKGIRIPSIVLFFFGGVAQMADEPRRPDDETKIAIAGPLFSFAMGGTLLFLWYFSQSYGSPVEVSAVLQYGATINLLVGTFNMLPAYPMDGGRVLRAGLWKRSNDILRATVTSVRISVIFGHILVYGGLGLLIFTGEIGAVWIFFIGLFLRSMAESSLVPTLFRHHLKGFYAGDFATDMTALDADMTLQMFSELYRKGEQRRFPVVRDDQLIGIFEPKDMKKVPRERWYLIAIEHIVRKTEKYAVIAYDMPATDIYARMAEHATSEAFVVSDCRFVGRISYNDLVRFIQAKTSMKTK